MPAARAAATSAPLSPTMTERRGSAPSCSSASSSRSGAGLRGGPASPPTTVPMKGARPSDATILRETSPGLLVQTPSRTPAAASPRTASRDPVEQPRLLRGARLVDGHVALHRRVERGSRERRRHGRRRRAPPASARRGRSWSRPRRSDAARWPYSPRTSPIAAAMSGTLSTSVPSRSNRTASGRLGPAHARPSALARIAAMLAR